jgi:hypothetical protein
VLAHLATVAPESSVLERLLERSRRLAQGRRRRRILFYVAAPTAALLVLGLGGFGGWRYWKSRPAATAPVKTASTGGAPFAPADDIPATVGEPAKLPPPRDPEPERPAPRPATKAKTPSTVAGQAPREQKAKVPPTAAEPENDTRMGKVIFAIPGDVDVFWDGTQVDPTKPLDEVKPGRHKLRLERDGYDPIETIVRVRPGPATRVRVGD